MHLFMAAVAAVADVAVVVVAIVWCINFQLHLWYCHRDGVQENVHISSFTLWCVWGNSFGYLLAKFEKVFVVVVTTTTPNIASRTELEASSTFVASTMCCFVDFEVSLFSCIQTLSSTYFPLLYIYCCCCWVLLWNSSGYCVFEKVVLLFFCIETFRYDAVKVALYAITKQYLLSKEARNALLGRIG